MQIHSPINGQLSTSTARTLGRWFDDLGTETAAGAWGAFATITYKPEHQPWRRGFPSGGERPSIERGHSAFRSFVAYVHGQLGTPVEYIVADQFGTISGRFHQHALLSAPGLHDFPRYKLERWLRRYVKTKLGEC
jgi:hypothetical protein